MTRDPENSLRVKLTAGRDGQVFEQGLIGALAASHDGSEDLEARSFGQFEDATNAYLRLRFNY